jgi:hypothetical protein
VPHIILDPGDTPEQHDESFRRFLSFPNAAMPYSHWFDENFNAENQARQLARIIESRDFRR